MPSLLSPSTASVPDNAVKDVTLASFKADVLEASRAALVLVAFCAAWDASCKSLTGALEKLARASGGAVRLAKVDIDKNQAIAQQMGVQSVPSVYAFYQGRPVDAFAGALPEAQIKAWLDQLMQATGVVGAEKAGLDVAFKQAEDDLATGDIARARAIYADILDMEPENAKAYAGLVRCLFAENEIAKARAMLDSAPAALAKDKAFDAVRAAIELAEQAGKGAGKAAEFEARLEKDPADHAARFDLALAYYAAGRNPEAVDQLLEIVRRARTWNEDAARKQLVKFFEAFGPTDPLTISARKRLSSILFS
ncbi:MAG: tetratricopeptide repeat protein [Alphaproteobacteria bacterium]|nr:tetratricopeptide repeat protein [Alphaproteobacteria bacterium]